MDPEFPFEPLAPLAALIIAYACDDHVLSWFTILCWLDELKTARWLRCPPGRASADRFSLTAEDALASDGYALRWTYEFGSREITRWLINRFGQAHTR